MTASATPDRSGSPGVTPAATVTSLACARRSIGNEGSMPTTLPARRSTDRVAWADYSWTGTDVDHDAGRWRRDPLDKFSSKHPEERDGSVLVLFGNGVV